MMRQSSNGRGIGGFGAAIGLAAMIVSGLPTPSWAAGTRTLQEALAMAYATNPTLLSERANLRATDENVPAALSGWRPTVSISANAGYADGSVIVNKHEASRNTRHANTEQFTIVQPIYSGGQTRAGTNRAENQVMGERARLLAQEQATFTNVVNAYVDVIQSEQVLALNVNNEQVLARQLQATNDRFRVGEITRTDVAQAEAALAGATATRQTAEGQLQTARSLYQQLVGEFPARLIEPQPLRLPTRTLEEAKGLASRNNPNVVAALFDDAAAKDNFDLQYSKLLPNLSLQAQSSRAEDVITLGQTTRISQVLASLTVPIYQGGIEYATIRQARQQQLQTRSRTRGRASHRHPGGNQRVGDLQRRQGDDREHAPGGPFQSGGARRRAARGDRRQPHHARRAERGAIAAELAGDAGAEPRKPGERVLFRRRRRRPADCPRSEPAGAAV